MKFKIASWNILRGKNFEGVINTLRHIQADTICLQEVIIDKNSDKPFDVGKEIATVLRYNYHFCSALDLETIDEHIETGNAILSKHPILKVSCLPLSKGADYNGNADTEPRSVAGAMVVAGKTILQVFSTHTYFPHHDDSPTGLGKQQVNKLYNMVQERRTVLAGDFNSEMSASHLQRLSKLIPNVDKEQTEPTFVNLKYNSDEKRRFDHIFASPDIKTSNFTVYESNASDHYPISVIAEL